METKTSSPFALLQDIWDNPHSSQLFLLSLCKLRQIITVLVTIQNFYSTREVDFGKHPKSSPSFAVQGHCALGVVFRNQLSETGCKKRKTEILHLHLILQLNRAESKIKTMDANAPILYVLQGFLSHLQGFEKG